MSDTVRLAIGKEIEMLSGPPPTVEGLRAMQVRDLIIARIPTAAAKDKDRAVRLWNIGLAIDKEDGDTFEMSKPDCELLRDSIVTGQMEVWARVNLDKAFDEAMS